VSTYLGVDPLGLFRGKRGTLIKWTLSLHISLTLWLFAAFAAFLIGLSKTGLAGVGILPIVIFAHVLPARESTGAVLPLLICADIVAVSAFRRHASWRHLIRLFPWAAAGVVIGFLVMHRIDDHAVKHMIGVIIVLIICIQLIKMRIDAKMGKDEKVPELAKPVTYGTGLIAGFTTMTANAAGPIMLLYLLASGLPKMEFIGTGAWYFLLLNLFKVPFSAKLGLIRSGSLLLDLSLAPFAIVGALTGKAIINHINQKLFAGLALGFALVGGLDLLFAP
jgi:uncharacterized membrane protein YfcA